MSYYAVPVYIGVSCLLSLSYSCIECVKEKGDIDNASKSILCIWVIVSSIVASIIAGAVGEIMVGMTNYIHLFIALIMACVTLSISSSLLYWS